MPSGLMGQSGLFLTYGTASFRSFCTSMPKRWAVSITPLQLGAHVSSNA